MSTLNPPVALEKKENEPRVEYIQDYASSKSLCRPNLSCYQPLSAPQVRTLIILLNFMNIQKNYGKTRAFFKPMRGRMSIN